MNKINLTKGGRVNLVKTKSDGSTANVSTAFLGADWSAGGRSVDLDLSVILFDENKTLIDQVWFRQKVSNCRAIVHSGDDLTGDTDGDDGLDNEVIRIDLSKVNPKAAYIVAVLNAFTGERFDQLTNISCRIYTNETGNPDNVDTILAKFKLDDSKEYASSKAIVMGYFYKRNGEWKFAAVGDGTTERSLEEIARGSALKAIY